MVLHVCRVVDVVFAVTWALVAHYGRNSAELRIPLRITEILSVTGSGRN